MTVKFVEKRAHPRIPYGAWVTVKSDADKRFHLAQDLSLGGMQLTTDDPPELGKLIDLMIVVEGERDPIEIKGHVVRHAPAGGSYGVKFDEMSEEAAARLLGLVQSIIRDGKKSP